MLPCSRELLIPALFIGCCHSNEDVKWRWSGSTRRYPRWWPNTAEKVYASFPLQTVPCLLWLFLNILPLETESRFQSEPCHCATRSRFKWINAEDGRTVLELCSTAQGCLTWWWLWQRRLLPSKSVKSTEQLETRGFSPLLPTSSGAELVRRR